MPTKNVSQSEWTPLQIFKSATAVVLVGVLGFVASTLVKSNEQDLLMNQNISVMKDDIKKLGNNFGSLADELKNHRLNQKGIDTAQDEKISSLRRDVDRNRVDIDGLKKREK